MKIALYIILGAAGMYLILKALSKLPDKSSEVSKYATQVMGTVQFRNLAFTNEFRELIKTDEARHLLGALADEQLKTFATSIT
jgi:hypothetical protein